MVHRQVQPQQGFPTVPITPFLPRFVYTVSTTFCMQATFNCILCFHGNGRGCISNPLGLAWAILTLLLHWEQQTSDVTSNHGATAEPPLCPLCSNMHPSRVTITLIQLVLLKTTEKTWRAMSILIWERKVSLSQQDNDQNTKLYNSTLCLIAPNTQEWPETLGRGEKNLFLINGFINKGKRAAVLNIPLAGLLNGWAMCFIPAKALPCPQTLLLHHLHRILLVTIK